MAMMIKRDKDEAERSEANTYLAMALAAPVERGAERPCITGVASVLGLMLPLPTGSPWSGDPCGDEPPLGYAIDDQLAALGGAGSHEPVEPLLHSTGSEVSPPLGGGEGEGGER